MKARYIVDDFDHCLAHVIEEMGEALAAAGKTLRWGWWSVNPEVPESEREFNLVWLERELDDLEGAIARLRTVIAENRLPAPEE